MIHLKMHCVPWEYEQALPGKPWWTSPMMQKAWDQEKTPDSCKEASKHNSKYFSFADL